MSFNVGLSALNAAQQEIDVTGNNISNAGTTGFKSSRANFGDVYAASVSGGGSGQLGGGVSLQDISQNFSQGNVNFTNNTMDMAINGEGFFVTQGESGSSYTRAGNFGTDKDGYVVNSRGDRLQGFAPTSTGEPSGGGPLNDLQIQTGEIQPRPTTVVESQINLDAGAEPSSVVGTDLTTNSGTSGDPQQIAPGDDRLNGYGSNAITVTDSDGVERQVSVDENSSANEVAQSFSSINGVTARGTSRAFITNIANGGGGDPAEFAINGLEFSVDAGGGTPLEDLAADINSTTSNLSAEMDGAGNLMVTHSLGANLEFSGSDGSMDVEGSQLNGDGEAEASGNAAQADFSAGQSIVQGGTVEFTLEENVSMAATVDENGDPVVDENGDPVNGTDGIFGDISGANALAGESFENNTFDPNNPDTYYRSTAVDVYDSLGNSHSLTSYFVRERPEAGDVNNVWSVYLQIDGEDIGFDPNTGGTEPTLARHEIRFDDNGQFDPNQPPIEITNWTPVDDSGRPNAAGPVPGNPNVSDETTNSNFTLDLSRMTQFGGDFSVQSTEQDGYSKGQLTGLEIGNRGLVSARFSNGQSRAVGEVALANFSNPEGLTNLGGTRFAETAESGEATVSGAGTAGLGVIESGALEESNVDLPEQLVQLIVSQRNYQAAAQVISTTDTTTQTIMQL